MDLISRIESVRNEDIVHENSYSDEYEYSEENCNESDNDSIDLDNDDLLFIDPDMSAEFPKTYQQNFATLAVFNAKKEQIERYERMCMLECIKVYLQDQCLSHDDKSDIANEKMSKELSDKMGFLKTMYDTYLQYIPSEPVDGETSVAYNSWVNDKCDENALIESYPDKWCEGMIKLKGTFNTHKEADEFAEKVTDSLSGKAKIEGFIPIFYPNNGLWYAYDPDPTSVENQRTPNEEYNKMHKGKVENDKRVAKERAKLEKQSKLKPKFKRDVNKRLTRKKGNKGRLMRKRKRLGEIQLNQ